MMPRHRTLALAALLAGLAAPGLGCTAESAGGDDSEPAATGDLVRGGALYDKWWVVLEKPAPEGDHPLWAGRPDTGSNARKGADTWRCKECHGWDYLGAAGAYGSGSHKTGIAGVSGAAKKPAAELEKLILEDHGYGAAGFSEKDARDVAAFIRDGLIDTTALVGAEKKIEGDAAAGKAIYEGGVGGKESCAECHGADGLQPPAEDEADFEDFPGKVANENPWELLHKVRFGQPGTDMPALAKDLDAKKLGDLGAHVQTLPTAK